MIGQTLYIEKQWSNFHKKNIRKRIYRLEKISLKPRLFVKKIAADKNKQILI